MRVLSICEYYAEKGLEPDHFVPWYVVHGIKKDKPNLKGYRDVEVRGRRKRISKGSEDVAIEWAAERLARVMNARLPEQDIAIVPIPGSKQTSPDEVKAGRGFQLAQATAALFDGGAVFGYDAIPVPLLFWKNAKPRAHDEGGTRDPERLAQLLTARQCHRKVIGSRTVVLLDDVVTSGGTMLACYKFLQSIEHRYAISDVAYAVARTVRVKGSAVADKLEPLPRRDDRLALA